MGAFLQVLLGDLPAGEILFETTNEAKIRMNVNAFLPTRNAIRFEQNAVRAALGHLSAAAGEGRA